jgi:hypothetical protein
LQLSKGLGREKLLDVEERGRDKPPAEGIVNLGCLDAPEAATGHGHKKKEKRGLCLDGVAEQLNIPHV